jgi:hypothetical protein
MTRAFARARGRSSAELARLPSCGPVLSDELDELEHQALDRLDDLEASGERDATDDEAIERVAAMFDRLLLGEARRLLDAAEALALAEPERAIGRPALAEVRAALAENPELAPALTPAIELLGLGLGLTRDRFAWSLAIARSEAAAARAPAAFASLSTELSAVLREVWPQPNVPSPSLPARAFRLEVLGGGGPSVRARALAAEHPEHGKLASALLLARPEASARELVEAFEQARNRIETAAVEQASAPPVSDGPKRRFTWVHALLAAIILGLTLWHYLAR